MATLKDIAERTGYSATTVSRALRGCDDVTEETRQRIEIVAREMNYRPNQIARKLIAGRSGIVGLVLEKPPQAFEHGHFFQLVSSLSQAFTARDLDFVLHIGDSANVLSTHERLISRGAIDGFVLTLPVIDDPRINLLLEHDTAFVVHGHQIGDQRYAYFDTDNHAVSVIAVDVLAGLGHRRIAVLYGPEQWPSVAERVRGYRDSMSAHGLPVDPELMRHGDTSTSYGEQAAAELLAAEPARPTAIICCNSLVAAGVYEIARVKGLSVPTDLSVIAHDDELPQIETASLNPPLTVTKLPLRDAAEPLADLLVRRIAGEPIANLQITGAVKFIERKSTAPPNLAGQIHG